MLTRLTRLAGLCGLLTPTITLTLIFVSIKMSPWFSWHDNALSDMGVSQTFNLFNPALLIGGGLHLVFVIGGLRSILFVTPHLPVGAGVPSEARNLSSDSATSPAETEIPRRTTARNDTSRMARAGFGLLLAGAIALPLISIITEAYGRTHYYVAATYFVATPLAYMLIGGAWYRRGDRLIGLLSIAAGVAALVAITLVPHKRIAVPEILAATLMGVWTFAMGLKLWLESPEQSHA